MIGVAVVGYGYWGPNLARNFDALEMAEVVCVADLSADRLAKAARALPAACVTQDVGAAIAHPDVDAVVVATPVSTHFDLARRAIEAGKHVLVEKPMACTAAECEQLIGDAERQGVVLMVDHTFPYTGAVRELKRMIDARELGQLYYFDSVRVNLGLFQHDVNVIWDLAVHDIAILDYLIDASPSGVAAHGARHLPSQPENIAYVTLFYDDDFIAHIHVNWLSPVKVRKTLVGGSRRLVVYDDLAVDEKLRVYDSGVMLETDPDSIRAMRVAYRTGDFTVPKLDGDEALARIARHFVACVAGRERPIIGADAGCRVVRLLEAATESMHAGGTRVAVGPAAGPLATAVAP